MTPTQAAPSPDSTSTEPVALKCMEIYGGNMHVDTAITTPGFDVWLYSETYKGEQAGGDIHYASMCAGGFVTRFAIADVSGHGVAVADAADTLRKLVRKHISTADQSKIVRKLNETFLSEQEGEKFATAILATYYQPSRTLLITNAGHPRPLWYRAEEARWTFIDEGQPGVVMAGQLKQGLANLPLGIIEPTGYSQLAVPMTKGDIIITYTDALLEACPPGAPRSENELGEQGLLDMARALDPSDPAALAHQLREGVRTHAGGDFADDATLLTMHFTDAPRPPMGVAERVGTLARMIGLSS